MILFFGNLLLPASTFGNIPQPLLLAPSFKHAPSSAWTEEPDGIVLKLKTGQLRLQVFSPKVIRVLFTPGPHAPAASLAVITHPVVTRWKATDRPDEVWLSTDAMEARVNKASGRVGFFDKSGKAILSETDGGRSLKPSQVGAYETLRSQTSFTLQPGEAIYGLGQHQQGIMNYRGSSVNLMQENREVAVPVLLSSRGYGVLWDNPAATTVSVDSVPEETIPTSQLSDDDGKAGGLTASYFQGHDFQTFVSKSTDSKIDFDWSKTPPPGLPHNHYSVRWTGFLQAKQAGEYTLSASADDGVRVWIDDKQLLGDWTTNAVETLLAKVNFEKDSRHRIRVEYYQDGGGAVVRLAWRVPSPGALPLTWTSEAADSVDYYFMYGPALDDVIKGYRKLTGSAPMMARWTWGFWQCKERYKSQQELLDVAEKYRSLGIPLDGLIQDWQYWTPHPWGSHLFDANRYPDPAKLMQDLHERNVHMIISVWPRFDVGSETQKELSAAGDLYPQVINSGYAPGQRQWYDPFNPAARKLYWEQISKHLFSLGLDGWWLDASEPELSEDWGEFRNYTTAAGPGSREYNAYPLMHTDAVYTGQRAEDSSKRVFILTRSAYAGQQRNSAVTWSGDIQGTWSVYAAQIPAGINFSMSGIPYWNTDTGGFLSGNPATPAYAELFTRWFQFSAFCPMFRVHGTNFAKEMWRFDDDTEKILADFDRLRYHLLPYIYSTSWMVTHDDYTMMRGLPMDFRTDPKVRDIGDQYMFGPALMACPVTKAGALSRPVYLPTGTTWTDFWTGESFKGGQSIEAPAPIDKMPLFVRAGSIIPYGPSIQYASEKLDPIELRVYRGANGSFNLYEDEGDNYNYEKGAHATIPISWNDAKHTLTIGKRQGEFQGMLKERTFRVVLVGPGLGVGTASSETADEVVRYSGEPITVRQNR